MSDHPSHLSDVSPPSSTPPAKKPVSGALEAVRRKREEISKAKTLTLNVPGYGGLLGVEYTVIKRSEITAFAKKAERAEKAELANVNADLLIRCCSSILVREDDDQDWEPIDPGETTTFSTGTLPELVDIKASSAREEVYGMFSPDGQQPLACEAHAGPLMKWLQGSTADIAEELLSGK